MESNAEIIVAIDKVQKELEALLRERATLTPKEAYEVREYAKSRTRLDVRVEDLNGEESAWRAVYYEFDKQFRSILGPEKKAELDSLEQERDTALSVSAALERLAQEPWWKRAWVSVAVGFWKKVYKIANSLKERPQGRKTR